MIGRAINDVTINGIFGAGGDTMFDMYSLAVCMWCLAIPLAAAGTYYFHWPVVVVYACTCIDEVGKLPGSSIISRNTMGEGPDTLTFSKPVFHHPVVAGNQQCAGSEPCKGAGDADGEISKNCRKSQCCCDAHNKFDHTGSKWSPAISHTLYRCPVNGQ